MPLFRIMVNLAYGLLKIESKHTMEFCEKETGKKDNEFSSLALS